MEWIQVFTIIVSMLGGIYVFYQLTKQEIGIMRDQITTMNAHHREDMKANEERISKIDEKWERLFERVLIKEQAR